MEGNNKGKIRSKIENEQTKTMKPETEILKEITMPIFQKLLKNSG